MEKEIFIKQTFTFTAEETGFSAAEAKKALQPLLKQLETFGKLFASHIVPDESRRVEYGDKVPMHVVGYNFTVIRISQSDEVVLFANALRLLLNTNKIENLKEKMNFYIQAPDGA